MSVPGLEFFQLGDTARKEQFTTFLTSNTYSGSGAASRLLWYLESSNCQTVIREDWYIDRDFADAYGRLYARGYQVHPRFCQRLHCFSHKVTEDDFSRHDRDQETLLQSCYLGYSVVLPTVPQTIGRTIIKPVQHNNDFVLVGDEFPVNLLGFRLWVRGAPFIEQDHRVSACATASLWMAATALSKKYNVPYYSTTEITELASRKMIGSGRAIPSEGLTVQQMLDALQSMGYDTMCFEDVDARTAKDIVYKHIESQLPVILGVEFSGGRHALTVVGHSYDSSGEAMKTPNPDFGDLQTSWQPWNSSQWVPSFLVNCDQRGFYQKLFFLVPEEMPNPFAVAFENKEKVKCGVKLVVERWNIAEHKIETTDEYAALRAIVVILPTQVFLVGNQAEHKAAAVLLKIHKEVYGSPPPQHIVLRTYLVSSNEFKASLTDAKVRPTLPCPTIVHLYRVQRFSRYIWVTEIGHVDRRRGIDGKDLLVQGEVILDASSAPRSQDFISLHLKGKFMFMSPTERDIQVAVGRLKNRGNIEDNVPDDFDYSPIGRFS